MREGDDPPQRRKAHTMQSIQGGVRTLEGATIPTKKFLFDLLKFTPEAVEFYDTAAFDANDPIHIPQLPPITEVKLYVVGPDPYTKRSWYAQIWRTVDGTLKWS